MHVRKITAAAALVLAFIAATPIASAAANTQTIIYGQLDIGGSALFTESSGTETIRYTSYGASPRGDSFIGFKVQENLSDTIAVGLVVEIDNLHANSGSGITTRQSYIFFNEHGFGNLRFGTFRNSFSQLRELSPTSKNIVGGRPTTQNAPVGFWHFSNTSQNAFEIKSDPSILGGIALGLTASVDSQSVDGPTIGHSRSDKNIILSANYISDNWQANFVHGETHTNVSGLEIYMKNTAIGASYSINSWTLGVIGEVISTNSESRHQKAQSLEVSALHKHGNIDSFISFGTNKSEVTSLNSNNSLRTQSVQVGLIKNFSANTKVHATIGFLQSDNGSSTGYGLGIMHSF